MLAAALFEAAPAVAKAVAIENASENSPAASTVISIELPVVIEISDEKKTGGQHADLHRHSLMNQNSATHGIPACSISGCALLPL
jgi:hypothetical protein